MFDIRLREYTPAGVKGRVLPTSEILPTDAESATGRLTFTTTAKVAGRLEAPFVVGLEYNTGGKTWKRPRNDLFVVLEDAEDAADQNDVMRFTAQSYVGWLLSQALHWWNATTKDGHRCDYDATPGKLIRGFIAEAKGRGWGPTVTTDFTDTADSLGQSWQATDQIKMTVDFWKPLSALVQSWTEQGHFEWWSEGTTLRLARVGSGVDRTESIVLGGPGFTAAPAKTDFNGTFSTLVLLPDQTAATHTTNVGADTRFGNLETSMSLSGVKDHPTAVRQAQPVMDANRAKKLELSYDWTPDAGGPVPWDDFTIGDLITARRKTGRQPQRVIGMQVSKRGDAVTCRVIVGSKLVGLQAKIAKRVGSVGSGMIIGGSGSTIPSNPGPAPSEPAVPTGLHVDSNVGSWRPDGSAVSTVQIGWGAVATSTDGSALDIAEYEVASRTASGVLQTDTFTAGITAALTDWEPGVARYVAVRARSVARVWGDWSAEISVTPTVPSSIIPKPPVGLAVASNVGAFLPDGRAVATVTVTWTPVTMSLDNVPVDVAEYTFRVGQEAQRVTGPSATFTIPSGRLVSVTAQARTTLDVWGDPSVALNVTGANPAGTLAAPSVPILTTGLNTVQARWNGLLGTTAPPAGFGSVVVDTAPAETGPWTQVGSSLTGADVRGVKSTLGATVWVRLRSLDTLGRPGGTSAAASIVVTGVTGPDIEADSITGNHVTAGTLSVNHVEPAFGDSLSLNGNASINLLAGRADAAAESITSQQAELDAQAAQLAANQAATEAAQNGASSAGIAAAAAQAAAAAAQAGVDNLSLALTITPTDVRISRPGSPVALHLSNTDASFRRNGVAQTWWDENQMVVPKLKASQVVVGQTVITEGGGRTTWQRL
ncbi:hypothetical protein [Microbacterium aurantiacum]|uniref:hypothetical protein n=1 Tax=Microbacterium aurantiacum TaxID=162393 RepID=UPI000C80D6B4|nr:hypothetical protein [Microbacterium aurantiacum]